jgi:predicted Zn-dependent protease
LKELLWLGGGLIALTFALVALVSLAADGLARLVPFSYEQSIAARFAHDMVSDDPDIEAYLQRLADRLADGMALPDGMEVRVHYVEDEQVNAYATLGGHIVILSGLMQVTPDENALAMVLAHEIAHVKHRDPIVALGRGVLIGIVLAATIDAGGNEVAGRVLGDTGLMTVLHFNRRQESEADREALAAVARYYGHVGGATRIFEHFLDEENNEGIGMPELFATHPASTRRIDGMRELARDNGWATEGEHRALPDFTGGKAASNNNAQP